MTVVDEVPAGEVRLRLARLADELAAAGELRSPSWREAVLAVPRHLFLPRFYRALDAGFDFEPVTREALGDRAWLDLVYVDRTWVTQVDGDDDLWSAHPRRRQGRGTCSSTMPSLVVRMLEALDVGDEQRVLEVGTGTGYSTALLCHRLGAERVVSVEVDAHLSGRAGAALARLGHTPTLVVGDGGAGHPARAPYDRIIGTCSFTHVPYAWVEQTRPGGKIEVIVAGDVVGGPAVVLDVPGDGTASGRLGEVRLEFMRSRPQRLPELPPMLIPRPDPAHDHAPDVDPAVVLAGPVFHFLLQWRIPGLTATLYSPPRREAVFRTPDLDRWVRVYLDGDGRLRVREGDPDESIWDGLDDAVVDPAFVREVRAYRDGHGRAAGRSGRRPAGPLWPLMEDTFRAWDRLGRPGLGAFRLTVTPEAQILAVPGTDLRWDSPVATPAPAATSASAPPHA